MWQRVKNFRADDTGAVTVDWVVLTAGIVALGLLIGKTVGDETVETGIVLGGKIANIETGYDDL